MLAWALAGPGPLILTMDSSQRGTSLPFLPPPMLGTPYLHLTWSGRPVAQQDSVLTNHVKWLGDEGPVL